VRLLPASLLWRTLVVVVAALVLSQVTAVWLLEEYVTKPRVASAIRNFVSHLKTINAALQTMDEAQQQTFIARIAELEGIRIMPVRGNELVMPANDPPAVQVFRERIRQTFGLQAEVYVMRNEPATYEGPPPRRPRLWVRLPSGGREFWVSFPRGRIERESTTAFIVWGAVALALAVLATFFIVWRLNRPLAELSRAAMKLGKGEDPPPVGEAGPSEIRAVARAFNQMKDDLKKNERERATFLAGISHDLRTPLSRMRLEVEMLDGKVEPESQQGMVQDLDDMNAIIEQFIEFSRSEAAERLSPVNLSELAVACANRATRSGMQVRTVAGEVPELMLRPLAMQRLVDNLLGNAGRHAGGEIEIRTGAVDGGVFLSVLDRGPGIPAALVDHLKQPFTRRDPARSGSSGAGLGLAIANRVAILHGGTLELLPREGGGLEARLSLPA
jgi:two-component system, OmpR family, osmolarity sensor histidine kinase EnvZ